MEEKITKLFNWINSLALFFAQLHTGTNCIFEQYYFLLFITIHFGHILDFK